MKPTPMAQHAYEILPHQGHKITAQYILANLSDDPQPPQHLDSAVYVLKDNSVVHYTPSHISFTCPDHDGTITTFNSVTRSSFFPHHLPYEPRPPKPLCHWPNEEDLYNQVLSNVYMEASDHLGLTEHPDNNLPQHLAYAAAPSLAAQINDVLTSFHMPDDLQQLLDTALQQTADDVRAQIPDEQFEHLVKLATKDLAQTR